MRSIHQKPLSCKVPGLRFFIIIALLPLLLGCQTGAKALYGDLGKPSDPVPFMENARTGVLPSGLRYYILENSRPSGRAYLTLAVNAGSVLETDDEQGLAHFVEHMAFNGTERFPGAELVNYLRSLGMRFGPEVNAYTSYDETVYGIEVPVETAGGIRRIPDTALAVIDDWTRAISFTPKDVDDERRVIMEEYRTRLGAAERIRRQMLPIIFRGSPYAVRLPIGIPEVIENAPAERLEGFYKKWYRSDNMALIFVGDFDAEILEASLKDHFHISPAAEPIKRPRFKLPEPKKGAFQALVQTDPEYPQTRIDLYFKRKAELKQQDIAGYRNEVIGYLADTILAFRFDETLSNPRTSYVRAGSGTVRFGYGSRYYVLMAMAKPDKSAEVLRELLEFKESLVRYGFTEAEADMAKRALLASMEQMAAEKDRQDSNSHVQAFTRHFLEGETVPDIEWELEAIKAMLPSIKLKDINREAKNYFIDDDLSVFVSAPEAEKGSLPSAEEIRTMVSQVKKARIAPPISAVLTGELLDEVPLPGEIIFEAEDPETHAIYWQLGNGMDILLKETSNKNNEISFYALSRGGTLNSPPEKDVSVSLAAEMMNASGLGPYTRPELTKKLADKQVSFSFWASAFIRGFQGSTAAGDLKVLMEMIYLGFTQARIDEDAVQVLLERRRTRLVQEAESPDAVFSKELTKTLYGNPRFHPLELEDLEKININDAMNFIRLSQNPSDYTFVFSGSLDLNVLRPLVQTYLASVPIRDISFNEWIDEDYMRPGKIEKEIRKGREERSTVYIGWFKPMEYTEENSAAAAVLQEYLDIRLTEEIRESLGGVYSISAGVSLSPLPRGELSGGLYFICNPQRAEELSAAAIAQIEMISRGDISEDILVKSREALIQSHEQSIQSNLYISQSYANSMVIYHSPLSRLDKRPGFYQAVNSEDIQYLAAQLLEGGPARIVLYPEE